MSICPTTIDTSTLTVEVREVLAEVQREYRPGNKPTRSAEERRYVRHEFVQPLSVCLSSADALPQSEPFDAQSRNISLLGIGLVMDRQVQTGDHLLVHLMLIEPEPRFVTLLVEVRFADSSNGQQWFVGCLFRESLGDAVG